MSFSCNKGAYSINFKSLYNPQGHKHKHLTTEDCQYFVCTVHGMLTSTNKKEAEDTSQRGGCQAGQQLYLYSSSERKERSSLSIALNLDYLQEPVAAGRAQHLSCSLCRNLGSKILLEWRGKLCENIRPCCQRFAAVQLQVR